MIDFLHETWSVCLFHDHFPKERQCINESLLKWAEDVQTGPGKTDTDTATKERELLKVAHSHHFNCHLATCMRPGVGEVRYDASHVLT